MCIFITGVAGFIGCNLALSLLERGNRVAGFDNLCRGSRQNLTRVLGHPKFSFECVDLADIDAYRSALSTLNSHNQITEIWHLAANSDIPAGIADPNIDLRDTFMTTYNTLLLMKELGIGSLAFASSSAIYGDHGKHELTEDLGPLFPISNYGAMKLASEAVIGAALESYLTRAWVFRFPNVIGTPATHGVILDFIRKLKATPDCLDVLGDGTQQKSYLHVEELIDAMIFIKAHTHDKLNYYNIGAADEGVTVRFIAESVKDRIAPNAMIIYGHGSKGWVGDVPKFSYSTAKLTTLGWEPTLSSSLAIKKAVDQIAEQELDK